MNIIRYIEFEYQLAMSVIISTVKRECIVKINFSFAD